MRKSIRLSEDKLRGIIKENVKRALNESFENPKLAEMVREHEGLKKIDKYVKDARTCDGGGLGFDIRYANPTYYLSPETVEEIINAGLYFGIQENVLYTNDGGAIVIESGEWDLHTNGDEYRKTIGREYDSKMYQRGKNFTEDNPESERFGGKWEDYGTIGKYSHGISPGKYRSTVARERRDAHQQAQSDSRKNKK